MTEIYIDHILLFIDSVYLIQICIISVTDIWLTERIMYSYSSFLLFTRPTFSEKGFHGYSPAFNERKENQLSYSNHIPKGF